MIENTLTISQKFIDSKSTISHDISHIIFDDTVKQIPYQYLILKNTKSIYIGKNVEKIGAEFCVGTWNLEKIEVDKENPNFDSRENCNCIIETASNKLIRGCKSSVIPDTVTEIGPCAFQSSCLEQISIPDSVKKIGANAFYNTNLKEITLPEGITEIKPQTFQKSSKLKIVNLPATLKKIGEQAFYECIRLESLTCPENLEVIAKKAFSEAGIEELILNDKLISIGDYAFYNIRIRKNLTLSSNLTHIGTGAFGNFTNTALEKPIDLIIPDKIRTIKSKTFKRSKIKKVILGENVLNIEKDAFKGCEFLKDVELNSKVSFAKHAFRYTPYFKDKMKLDEWMVNKTLVNVNIKGSTYIIPPHIEIIESHAFSEAKPEIIHGRGVKIAKSHSFGLPQLFSTPSSLKEVVLPKLEIIETNTFRNCKNLTKIIVSDHVKNIDKYAFSHIENLKDFCFNRVDSISMMAFDNCNIENLMFNSIGEIKDTAFVFCSIKNLYLPDSVYNLGIICNNERVDKIYIKKDIDKFKKNNSRFFDAFFEKIVQEFSIDELIEQGRTFKEINKLLSKDKISGR